MSELSTPQTSHLYWLAFTLNTSEDEARQTFRSRYGRDPEIVGISLGNVLAGPIPERPR